MDPSFARRAAYSGAGAALAALAALVLLSRFERQSPARPINATSHVLYGPDACRDGFDLRHTLPGLLINIGSAFFWGLVFALGTRASANHPPRLLVRYAFLTSLVAAIVDYGIVPRRLRPGWELALKARSVALALAAMGAGLAGGGLAAQAGDRSRPGEAE
ncbi:MAG: hypothetical protein K5872_09740 [Rhizobiaceae bacterium]|nr:hypothetical protein [Rhizobiaceae bacterium]MCV0406495.1 hypothetical protein [Rhizobiaceae bacterium]